MTAKRHGSATWPEPARHRQCEIMKRFLLWSFERGSIHYDIICGIILVFILIPPAKFFYDRPDYMRVLSDPVRQSHDDDGNPVFTVKLQTGVFPTDDEVTRQAALKSLAETLKLKMPVPASKIEPVHDTTGT